MKARIVVLLGLLGILLSLLAYSGTAYACSCGRSPAKQYLNRATAVFTGRIVSEQSEKLFYASGATEFRNTYTVEVHSVWKGIRDPIVEVISYSNYVEAPRTGIYPGSTCDEIWATGKWLIVGETYLIYAMSDPRDGKLMHDDRVCPMTSLLSDAAQDLQELGPGESVGTALGMPRTGEPNTWWAMGLWSATVIVASGYLLRRKGAPGE